MSIERLAAVIQPPEYPVSPGKPEDWTLIEQSLGIGLPQDYKDYIARFGSGSFHYSDFTFLYPFNPFSRIIDFRKAIDIILFGSNGYQFFHERYPEDYVYPPFPTPGGLLPWGTTDNGDDLYWITERIPDDWEIVIDSEGDFERFPLSMTEFLAQWISGKIKPQMAPDLPLETLVFRPQVIS